MNKRLPLKISDAKINDFCQKHHVRKLSFFGSVLRKDFGPRSDVDVLVEFEPGYPIRLLRMAGIQNELSRLIKRKVDLRTPADLSRYFREDVLRTACSRNILGKNNSFREVITEIGRKSHFISNKRDV